MKNTNSHHIPTILHQWMTRVQINSYRELSCLAQVSQLQLHRLENGLLNSIPLGILKKIAHALNLSVDTFIDTLSEEEESLPLEIKATESASEIKLECQREAISLLESLLLQLPTFTHAVQNNPHLSATKLLPLLEPLKELLSHWGIEAIGTVGEIVTYNPQEHELMDNNSLTTTESKPVKIRYVGYRHHDKLLYRAQVSSILD